MGHHINMDSSPLGNNDQKWMPCLYGGVCSPGPAAAMGLGPSIGRGVENTCKQQYRRRNGASKRSEAECSLPFREAWIMLTSRVWRPSLLSQRLQEFLRLEGTASDKYHFSLKELEKDISRKEKVLMTFSECHLGKNLCINLGGQAISKSSPSPQR